MSLKKNIFKRLTAAEWTAANPLLAEGEPGFEVNTGKMKVGDGNTRWTSLAYQAADIADLEAKQDALISGTNIKTINSETILGSGDLVVIGDSNVDGGSASSVYLGSQNINGGGA